MKRTRLKFALILTLALAIIVVIGAKLIPHVATSVLGNAVLRGDTRQAVQALSWSADPNTKVLQGPVLRLAIQRADTVLVKALLRHGANPNTLNNGGTALTTALSIQPKSANDKTTSIAATGIVEALLDAGADPRLPVLKDLLSDAVRQPALLKIFLDRGIGKNDPNAMTRALDQATRSQNEPSYNALLAAGGQPSLYSAAAHGDLKVVRNLLRSGLAPETSRTPEIGGFIGLETPLQAAISRGQDAVAISLYEAGAGKNLRSSPPPLILAIRSGRTNLVRYLLAHGAVANPVPPPAPKKRRLPAIASSTAPSTDPAAFSPAVPGAYSELPLSVCTESTDATGAEIAALLVKAGVNVQAKDHSGTTALWYSAMQGNAPVTRFLLANGADPNAPNPLSGWTPLMTALTNCRQPTRRKRIAEVVRLLCAHGANVQARNKQGETVFDILRQRGAAGSEIEVALHGARSSP